MSGNLFGGDSFAKALAMVENSVKAGYDGSSWKPHASLEGGSATLAYGHKLTPEEVKSNTVKIGADVVDLSKGLTEQQAVTLLYQDIQKARASLQHTIPDFSSFDEKYKKVLVSIAFNVGSVREEKWPSLLKAIRAGDDKGVRKEMVTSYADPSGKRTPLTGRARDIADSLGLLK